MGSGGSPPSEVQLWRNMEGADSYTRVAFTALLNQTGNVTGDPNVYEFTPTPPVVFQEGDILGVYQYEDSSVVAYYQESTGPENFSHSNSLGSAPSNLIAPVLAAEYDYPLVTVEVHVCTARYTSFCTANPVLLRTLIKPARSSPKYRLIVFTKLYHPYYAICFILLLVKTDMPLHPFMLHASHDFRHSTTDYIWTTAQ